MTHYKIITVVMRSVLRFVHIKRCKALPFRSFTRSAFFDANVRFDCFELALSTTLLVIRSVMFDAASAVAVFVDTPSLTNEVKADLICGTSIVGT